MIKVVYFGNDHGWIEGLNRYLRNSSEFKSFLGAIESIESLDTLGEGEIDAVLMDTPDIQLHGITHNTQHIKISEVQENKKGDKTIYKYLTADAVLLEIIHLLGGSPPLSSAKNILIGASYETESVTEISNRIIEFYERLGNRILIIPIAMDIQKDFQRQSGSDCFGNLVYYATESETRLFEMIDECILCRRYQTDWIPRTNPFDFGQWNKEITESIVQSIEKLGRYDTLVWVLGSKYLTGFAPLFKYAEHIVWFSHAKENELDSDLSLYQELSGCKLDIKTTHLHPLVDIESLDMKMVLGVRK